MRTPYSWAFALAGLLVVPDVVQAQDDALTGMLAKLPESVNAVTVVNLESLLSSPRAKEEKWSTGFQEGYLSGALLIPPTVQTAVLASRYDPCTPSAPLEYGVARLVRRVPVSIRDLARKEHGAVDTIGGQDVAVTSRFGYVAQLAPDMVGGMAPPNRQEMSRWLKFAKASKAPVISEYLRDSILSKQTAHILLAVDLHDMMCPESFHAWVANCQTMKQHKSEAAAMEELFQGLKGIRFTAKVEQATTGQMRFDFAAVPTENQLALLQPLFVEWLEDNGAAIEEFADPGVHVHLEQQSAILETTLGDASLRRILTLIQLPTAAEEPALSQSEGQSEVAINRRYFQTIDDLVDELRKGAKKKNYYQSALWHENYARKIEQLSILHVDPELAKYGAYVASQLRALSASLRGVPLRVQELEGHKWWYYYEDPPQLTYSWGGGWWGRRGGRTPGSYWSWGVVPGNTHYYDNFAEIYAKQKEAIARGEEERTKIWSEIEQRRQEIRRQMAEKYQSDFAERTK